MMDCDGRSCLRMIVSFLLGVGTTLTLMVFYQSENFNSENFLERLSFGNGTVNVSPQEENNPLKELKDVLTKAANDVNTVILTQVNEAFAAPGSLLDLFLESFHAGENIEHYLNHLVIVATDENAYDRCKSLHPHCYYLRLEGVNYRDSKSYNTKDYIDMMWLRNKLQRTILELGFNLLFTDVDILWFRNPFTYISEGAHFVIASDGFWGDPYSVHNAANGGFLYAKSCNKTIEFYKFWYEAREKFSGNDQDVFNNIKGDMVSRLKVRLQFLDTTYIGTFCQLSHDLNKLCTLHADCCVGLDNKYHDLKIGLEEWKNFTARSANERWAYFHWKIPVMCKR